MLAALADPREEIRKSAVDRIFELRTNTELIAEKEVERKKEKKCPYKRQRLFIKPQLRYDSTDYIDAIDWETEVLHEPPYTISLKEEEIRVFYTTPLVLEISSHSVLTERTIRDVDELSTVTTSDLKRDGMIRAMHQYRKVKAEPK